MVCDISDTRVNFLESHIVVRIYELTTRSNRNEYSYAKVKVSREAGEVINKNSKDREPAEIILGGVIQNRFIFSRSTLEIETDSAWFKLYDARKVLDHGSFSKHYNEITVDDLVRDMFRVVNEEDDYNVITGWGLTDESIDDLEFQNSREYVVESLRGLDADGQQGGFGGFVNDAITGLYDLGTKLPFLDNGGDKGFKGITFEDVTPNEVLEYLEAQFGLTAWVTNDGMLMIGFPELLPTDMHYLEPTSLFNKPYEIQSLNIVNRGIDVGYVRVKGKQTPMFSGGDLGDIDLVYPIAEAYAGHADDEIDGMSITIDDHLDIENLAALEAAAQGILVQASMDYRSGNIVFNGIASKKTEELGSMTVGDLIYVYPQVAECGNSDPGLFTVTEVQHKVNPRIGWEVIVEVGQIPYNVSTSSMVFSVGHDRAFSSYKDYLEAE